MIYKIKQKALLIMTQGQHKTLPLTANCTSQEAAADNAATWGLQGVLKFMCYTNCSSWLMHIPVSRESQYGGGCLKVSPRGNRVLSLNVLEKVSHNQLRVLLTPALPPSPAGQPSIPTCLLPKGTRNDSFFTVKKRDTQNTAAE